MPVENEKEEIHFSVDKQWEILYNVFICLTLDRKCVSVQGKAALTGEIAVPCTCNPLQQGRIPAPGAALCRLTQESSDEGSVLRNSQP